MRSLAVSFALLAGMAAAAPETSPRPVLRAGTEAPAAAPVALDSTGTIAAPERPEAPLVAIDRGQGPAASLRPEARPLNLERAAVKAQKKQAILRSKGAVCGDPEIQGEVVGRVSSQTGGCGVAEAVKVRSVAGVSLSQQALMDCNTASALRKWVENSAKPTFKRTGGGLGKLQVAAHYICRTRNNQPGARVSEHGRGKAIDISAFQMRDGTTITVLNGWNAPGSSKALRRLHKEACGTFGTVLGPKSDRHHADHFHFDTARHGNGAYCR